MQETTSPYLNRSPGGLGKLLFQRRGALFHLLLACLVIGPFGLLMAGFAVVVVWKQGIGNLPELGVVAFGLLMLLGCGFWVYFAVEQYSLLRVHEGGVAKRGWGRTHFLLFEEIDGFWCGGGHVYAKGAYLGPSYSLGFYPARGSGKRPLHVELLSFRFNARIPQADQELENLRDWLNHTLSERMRQQIQAGRPVDWTKQLSFLPEGLEYQPKGKSGDEKQVYPYASISRAEMDWFSGNLRIFLGADAAPRISEKMVRQPNDVPGLMLLDWLRHTRTGQQQQMGK